MVTGERRESQRSPVRRAAKRSCGTMPGLSIRGGASARTTVSRRPGTRVMATRTRAMGDLHGLTAADAAALIRSRALSPVDLVDACLARIEAREPEVKAWVRVDADEARRVALERAGGARGGRFRGPLHGVPGGLKGIYHVNGLVTTA